MPFTGNASASHRSFRIAHGELRGLTPYPSLLLYSYCSISVIKQDEKLNILLLCEKSLPVIEISVFKDPLLICFMIHILEINKKKILWLNFFHKNYFMFNKQLLRTSHNSWVPADDYLLMKYSWFQWSAAYSVLLASTMKYSEPSRKNIYVVIPTFPTL